MQTLNQLNIRIAIFDDNDAIRNSLYQLLHHTTGLEVAAMFDNCVDAVQKIEEVVKLRSETQITRATR